MVMISELMIITIVIGGHIISAPAEIFFIVKMHRQCKYYVRVSVSLLVNVSVK